jgi:hypothetical protein
MPRHPSDKALAALAWINKKAKKLRREHKEMTQREAISKASAMYREKYK